MKYIIDMPDDMTMADVENPFNSEARRIMRKAFANAKKAIEIKPLTKRSVTIDLSSYVINGKAVIFYAVEDK